MKKTSIIVTVCIIMMQQALVVFAQESTNIEGMPDLYILNGSYAPDNQQVSVQVCQGETEFQGIISASVQAKFYQSNRSQTINTMISQNGCSIINFFLDGTALSYASSNILELSVDPLNTLAESSEYNNTYTIAAQFKQTQEIQEDEKQVPDFYVKSIFFDQLSEKIEVNYCQKNLLDQETYFPFVSIEIDKQIFGDKKVKLGQEGSGDECFTTRRHKDSLNLRKSGSYKIKARIDYTDDFVEQNEQNNSLEQIINVQLLQETVDEQQYILSFDFLKKACKYDNEYVIMQCGQYESLRTTLNQTISQSSNKMAGIQKETIMQEAGRIESKLMELENDFPYTLEGEELNRQKFIFEYSKYAIVMLKYYVTNEHLDNFINDMLK